MAPKPFPYPIGVGVDICHIPRLYNLVGKRTHYVTRWAKKVFTRLEWHRLWQEFYKTSIRRTPSEFAKAQLWIPEVGRTTSRTQRTHPVWAATETSYSLHNETAQHGVQANHHETQSPRTSFIESLAGNAHADTRPLLPSLYDPTPHVKLLAQYLAGRWAAKEAAIKAHRNRRLSLNDISILHPKPSVIEHSESSANKQKLHALIAPEITAKVVMNSQVAKSRGLLERQSCFPHVYGDVFGGQFVRMPEPSNHNVLTAETGRKFWVRGPRTKDEERQIAEISISHDHGYAVAVCMALDEKTNLGGSVDYIVDDGSGESVHEPEWGDEGWLDDTHATLSSEG
ncbi:MAG: hypothetical protein LQ343_005415 [Gyalolechia ehrenbergii]|nr:MAG: hypothetical protein LQ343_005415 [Gyalolechia ehrenbergii]